MWDFPGSGSLRGELWRWGQEPTALAQPRAPHAVRTELSDVEDLFGQPVSEGTLSSAVNVCAAALVETEAHIKQG